MPTLMMMLEQTMNQSSQPLLDIYSKCPRTQNYHDIHYSYTKYLARCY